jgi:decaprenylphospho-beta-D-erythro-pentofuranosid-2-ulose 2-reductase
MSPLFRDEDELERAGTQDRDATDDRSDDQSTGAHSAHILLAHHASEGLRCRLHRAHLRDCAHVLTTAEPETSTMRDAFGAVQSVLVLGGGSEIAQVTVERMVREGHTTRVVLAARDPEALTDAVTALTTAGATEVETVAFDALDPKAHVATIDELFARDGDIDVVLLAFGVLGDQEAFEADPVAAAEAVTVNHAGAVSSGLAAARGLRAQGHGSLVVLSSVAGERARRSNFVYGSSKAGLDAFAQGLSDSLVGTGVDVLIVRPGFVHTKMTEGLDPAPMSTTPEAVADAIIDGLARHKRIVWVPGVLRLAFSGMRHLPTPLWRRVSADA